MVRFNWLDLTDNGADGWPADTALADLLVQVFMPDTITQAPPPGDWTGTAETSDLAAPMPDMLATEPGPCAVADATAAPPAASSDPPASESPADPGVLAPELCAAGEELDLFTQFAGLYADFNGDQALSDLLGSDWSMLNGWHGADGAPLG